MSGQMFDYQAGRIDVRFRHEKHDWLRMLVRAYGDTITVTEVDDAFEAVSSRVLKRPQTRVSCRISSVFCPFRSFLAWLEAVAVGVQECAFEWDAEGPFGRLAWSHDHLSLDWHERDREKGLRMHADRKQAVRAFYTAFRRFVQSPEYEPLRYERLRNGEAMVLRGVKEFTEEELIGQLLVLSRRRAEERLQAVWPLQQIVGASSGKLSWVETAWDGWSTARRRAYLREVFDMRGLGRDGAPIRELRSGFLEYWVFKEDGLTP